MHNHNWNIHTLLQAYAPEIAKDVLEVQLSYNGMEEDKLIWCDPNNGVLKFKNAYDYLAFHLPNTKWPKKYGSSMLHQLSSLSVGDCFIM